MEEKTIHIKNIDIATYSNNSSNENSILFLHGNSLNSTTFFKQFNDITLNNYNLIAIDLPGHGNSSSPSNPEEIYPIKSLINFIKEVVQQLNLKNIILVGHSLGGHLFLELATELKDVKGILIFGTPPISIPPQMENMYLPHEALNYAFKGVITETEAKILATSFSKRPNNYKKIILQTDPNSRTYIGQSIGQLQYNDEVEICKNLDYPLAIIHGKEDVLINQEYFSKLSLPTLWKNETQIIENSGHSPQIENSIEFNKLLIEFTKNCF